jgi:hypothetical protein
MTALDRQRLSVQKVLLVDQAISPQPGLEVLAADVTKPANNKGASSLVDDA